MVVDNLELAPNRAKSRELLKHTSEIIDLYQNRNMTLREIGQKLGCDKGAISRLLKKSGIVLHANRTRNYDLNCQDCSATFSSKCPTAIRCRDCTKLERCRQSQAYYLAKLAKHSAKNELCLKCNELLINPRLGREYCDKCRRVRAYENKYSAWNKNPEHYRMKSVEHQQNRRARKHGSTSLHLDRKFLSILKQECDCCIYCNSKENLTIDHITPLSRNGDNNMNNLVLSCKSCNSSKHNKYLLNFLWSRHNSLGVK